MESFFQAAFNSLLEAAGGGSRSGRANSGSRSSSAGVSRAPSHSNVLGGTSGGSGGSSWRANRFGRRAASSPIPSVAPPTSRGARREAPSESGATRGGATQAGTVRDARTSSSSSSRSTAQTATTSGSTESKTKNIKARDREAAERLKDLGNESFRRGMYGLAAEYYSKAIAADATVPSYFTNRALCHKRENRYPEALQDAEAALALEETNVKGLYIKGDALVQLGDLDGGVTLLEKAERASFSATGRAPQEIRHSLLNAKKLRYARYQKQRSDDRKDLEAFLRECIEIAARHGKLPEDEVNSRLGQLQHVFAEAAEANAPFELPDFLTCQIAMGLMDEPVVTPSGITYERKLLLEHLNRNGPTDPVTREPCDVHRLVPNYAIKGATAWFLERHPWAYEAQ